MNGQLEGHREAIHQTYVHPIAAFLLPGIARFRLHPSAKEAEEPGFNW